MNKSKSSVKVSRMLDRSEFDLLFFLQNNSHALTQRELAEEMKLSLGKTNKLLRSLSEKGLISAEKSSYALTRSGYSALEPYKVKNAVIMAAGMSSRFAPLSYEKPKGLLIVKNEVLIEREIRQLHEAGIEDITVVVGYMKEKFFYLEEKFGVKIVVNEDYYKYNNTSTLIRVLDQLSNTYICSSDNYFVDNVFAPYVYQAYYAAVYGSGKTDEYCLTTSPNGRIKSVSIGGENAWYMLGHVYFDRAFSDKFRQILLREYENPVTKEQLWENLYMRYIDQLDLYIKKYSGEKVKEFDSLEELRSFDAEYINNADSEILRSICKTFHCEIKDIGSIQAIKAGLTNSSFKFIVNGSEYVYRHPGRGTEKYIDRKSEAFSMKIASELGLDDTFIRMDEEKGWKISKFISNARELDYHDQSQVSKALAIMRTLHGAAVLSPYEFDIWKKTERFVELLRNTEKSDYEDFDKLYQMIVRVKDAVASDPYSVHCLCHNDCYSPNFLLDEQDKMYLIDWEYSGNDDPASDLGTFICCSDYTYEEALDTIEQYLQHKPEQMELGHYIGYIAIASYYWYIWALYQETRGNPVGEWLYLWYKNSKVYGVRALALLEI